MFQTSVFPIPAGAKRTVTLRYTQLCRQSHGLTDFLFPLATAKYTEKPLDKFSLQLAVESSAKLKNIYSPTHAIELQRPDSRHAVVSFESKKTIPAEDFRLFFDAANGEAAASLVSYRPEKDEDGYFLLLASPEIEPAKEKRAAKTVVFAVDRSGSMSGEKMDQAKEAARFVLNNLHEGDTFNIVAYDSEIETFRPELEKFNDDTREAALGFVNGLYAGGSTNIDGALSRALGMLKDTDRPSYVIFLTDGLPTVGETSEAAIASHAEDANEVRARVFAFGVGYDVNSRLLDKVARNGHGQSEYVRPNEDIETAVSNLYRRIGAPVMTDVELDIDVEGAKRADGPTVSRVYPGGSFDLFAGDQAVIVGRYRLPGAAKVTLSGNVHGDEESLDFPAELVATSDDDTNSFVAKLWATRRVGEIIDELDLKGRNEELIKELVDLATKHGILTPYTSFLADDTSAAGNVEELRRGAESRLSDLSLAEGELGVSQRAAKEYYRAAAAPATPASGGYGYGGAGLGAAADRARSLDGYAESASDSLAATGGRGVLYYDVESQQQVVARNVIAVGRKTFFRRGDKWVDSAVSDDEAAKARKVERFTREYFDLAQRHGKHVAQYMSIDEPVVVKLGDEVYVW
jgi:Ca-activated chloride channel family protein